MKNNYPLLKSGSLAIVIFLIQHLAISQTPDFLWEQRFGGIKSDNAVGISEDPVGNIYMVGQYASPTVTFGAYAATDTFQSNLYLVKLNPAGSVQWLQTGGGSITTNIYASVTPAAIATDASGNTYMAGYFETDTLILGSNRLANSDTGGYTNDVFIAKFDASGNVIWLKGFGARQSSQANGLALDAAGNAYITGTFSSDSITFGAFILTGTGQGNIFTLKMNPAGQVIWAQSAGGSGDNTSLSIAAGPQGDIYTTGFFSNNISVFGTDTLYNPLYGYLIFVAKYDSLGHLLWAKSAGNDSSYQYGYGIAADPWDNAYITGSFHGRNIQFGSTILVNDSFGNGNDAFLVKYDPNGNVLWAKSAGGKALDLGWSVTSDSYGGVYETGYFWSRPFVIGHDTFDLEPTDGSAIFAAKYDTAGNELWAKFIYSNENATSSGMVVDGSGNTYVDGYFLGTYLGFDSALINNADNSGLTSDIFVTKIGSTVSGICCVQVEGIHVFPNPANSILTIEGLSPNSVISLSDLTGRIVMIESTVNNPATLDLSAYSPGIYILHTSSGSMKIVKM